MFRLPLNFFETIVKKSIKKKNFNCIFFNESFFKTVPNTPCQIQSDVFEVY